MKPQSFGSGKTCHHPTVLFLSLPQSADDARTEWWAGGAGKFITPIETFAQSVAQAAIVDAKLDACKNGRAAKTYLDTFQQELIDVGALGDVEDTSSSPSLDVTAGADLAKIYTNMVFCESVFHSGIFATREYFLSIAMPMTSQFLPYLVGEAAASEGIDSVDTAIDRFVTTSNLLRDKATPIETVSNVFFSTTAGLNGAPEISDGPCYNQDSSHGVGSNIKQYQAGIAAAQSSVMRIFGILQRKMHPEKGFCPATITLSMHRSQVSMRLARRCPFSVRTDPVPAA